MKAFCIGLQRTGTTSYSLAATSLGVADWHFPMDYADAMLAGETPLGVWDARRWDGMSCFHELPAEWRALDLLYPDAVWVLTTRGVDRWLRSIRLHMEQPWPERTLRIFTARWQSLFGVPFDPAAFDPGLFRHCFLQHDADARDYFGDRLHVVDLDGGQDKMRAVERALAGFHKPYPHARRRAS